MVARFVDRIGKGIRGAPRDAPVADLSPPEVRGASFGLMQSLDTVGAFLGPLVAITLMWLTLDKFTFVFWMAVLPAFFSFFLIVVAVKEPERAAGSRQIRNPISRAELYALGAPYWWIVAIGALFTLARFSEAFLILKAQSVGLSLWLAPVVLVAMNLAYALAAYPAGVLSDRGDRRTILIAGFAVLVAADVVLAMAHGISTLALGVVLWGLHMGLTQGLLATLLTRPHQRSLSIVAHPDCRAITPRATGDHPTPLTSIHARVRRAAIAQSALRQVHRLTAVVLHEAAPPLAPCHVHVRSVGAPLPSR